MKIHMRVRNKSGKTYLRVQTRTRDSKQEFNTSLVDIKKNNVDNPNNNDKNNQKNDRPGDDGTLRSV